MTSASGPDRKRLDQRLAELGLADSRSRAQSLILAGKVTVNGIVELKTGRLVAEEAVFAVTGLDHPWVSRGGIKLAAALNGFAIDPSGRTALDIGASTGGFTDVLLTRGAKKVFAVDVGHGQLAAKLRTDPRVVSIEHVNARNLSREHIPEPIGMIVCDVSFISLRLALPPALGLAAPGAYAVALIKPQFELGAKFVGKGGVVRDRAAQEALCAQMIDWMNGQDGWKTLGVLESPITGPDGNREFLIAAHRD